MKTIPIIYFHSVALKKNKLWYKNHLTLELIYFEDLIKYLIKNRYSFLFLDEYFQLRNSEKTANKHICLTFDDGYLDNYVYVYPLLKKYGIKATIFVNPEFTPDIEGVRPTLEQIWNNEIMPEELEDLGFISWNEMKVMESSGLVDIQSHTLTHSKVIASAKINSFHNPNSDYLNPIANQFPERKPFYITDPEFKHLLPYGTPFFELKSAVITRKISINQNFITECVSGTKGYDWQEYSYDTAYEIVKPIYDDYIKKEKLIDHYETEKEYESRVRNELKMSKNILEEKLNKEINYCCWPHGDYNDTSRRIAIEEGYKATTIILKPGQEYFNDDAFNRLGVGSSKNNRILSLQKSVFNINYYEHKFPYYQIKSFYYLCKNYQ